MLKNTEKPKNLVEEFVLFFGVTMEDTQRYDEKIKGLKDLEGPKRRTRFTSLQLRQGKIRWQHCPESFNELDDGQLQDFETRLRDRLFYLQENILKGAWDKVGNIANQNVGGGGFLCETCKIRYGAHIVPIPNGFPRLLEKLRLEKLPLE